MSLAISLQEAAHLLSVEDRTVRNWVHRVGIQTIPDLADGRRRLITDDDLKLLADRFRRPLAPDPHTAYNVTNSPRMAPPETPSTPASSPGAKDETSADDVRAPGSNGRAQDEELLRVLKALDQLTSEVSYMRAKVDLLVKTALVSTPADERLQPADDMSGETRPLRHPQELANTGG